MQQMKIKDAMVRKLMTFLFVTIFSVGLAFGQTMRFEVPYAFSFGPKVLPAGTYTFAVHNGFLVLGSDTGVSSHGNIITRLSGPAEFLRDGSLVFDKGDSGLTLSEVWLPGIDGLLLHSIPKGHSRSVLTAPNLDLTHTYTGKAAYNLTCGRCHGPDGNGDKRADKFFNLTIPRLTSAAVQNKPDAELKQLITQGSSVMPPVEIDEAGFRHRLPPQDVDAVIAYVHTLRQ
jgi:cytochrome c553